MLFQVVEIYQQEAAAELRTNSAGLLSDWFRTEYLKLRKV